jgi:hypothetical protein
MKDCPRCRVLLDDAETACPGCGHAFTAPVQVAAPVRDAAPEHPHRRLYMAFWIVLVVGLLLRFVTSSGAFGLAALTGSLRVTSDDHTVSKIWIHGERVTRQGEQFVLTGKATNRGNGYVSSVTISYQVRGSRERHFTTVVATTNALGPNRTERFTATFPRQPGMRELRRAAHWVY